MSKISIIASFRNEQENLDLFISRIEDSFEKLENFEYEIVFVDDNSNDKSLDILKKKIQLNKKIKVIKMKQRYGHSPSIQAALENISDKNYTVIIDCDLQDPPELISENLKNILSDETIHFVRNKRDDGLFQKLYSYVAYIILNIISGGKIFINAGYFKIMPPKVTKELKNNNEFLPFWSYLITKLSVKNRKIFYSRKPRFKGSSKYSIFSINPWLTFYGGLYYFKIKFFLFSFLIIIFFTILKSLLTNFLFLQIIFNIILIFIVINILSFSYYLNIKSKKKKIKCDYDLINF